MTVDTEIFDNKSTETSIKPEPCEKEAIVPEISCLHCDYKASSGFSLGVHMHEQHQVTDREVDIFRCVHCTFTHKSRRGIRTHKRETHFDTRLLIENMYEANLTFGLTMTDSMRRWHPYVLVDDCLPANFAKGRDHKRFVIPVLKPRPEYSYKGTRSHARRFSDVSFELDEEDVQEEVTEVCQGEPTVKCQVSRETTPSRDISENIPSIGISENIPSRDICEDIISRDIYEDIPSCDISEVIPSRDISDNIPSRDTFDMIPREKEMCELSSIPIICPNENLHAHVSVDLPERPVPQHISDPDEEEEQHRAALAAVEITSTEELCLDRVTSPTDLQTDKVAMQTDICIERSSSQDDQETESDASDWVIDTSGCRLEEADDE